ncbi:class I SAM-dependent methyltransferase [Pollutibacter soli]|uniref:class I SAM-dependent methyltransferase n=1 Tax=Pollutibacter soli TaxID=3034157 RepID=UPI003013BA9E
MPEQQLPPRDFDSISPSAKWILIMKAHTTIPFSKRAMELVSAPEKFEPDFENPDLSFWVRTMHFENRYKSINHLMEGIDAKNILELSSGFSFRGLDLAQHSDVHYIDTDLPDMVAQKQKLVNTLKKELPAPKGTYELATLNALDEKSFDELVSHFLPGELTIVNEGLLMYLNTTEKEKLCRNIHKILLERGGCWITADIYIALKPRGLELNVGPEMKKFFEVQKIEENYFKSFEQAAEFFDSMGFIVDKKFDGDYSKLSVLPQLIKRTTPEDIKKFAEMPKIHSRWRLRVKNSS